MIYLLANNRSYTKKDVERLRFSKRDVCVLMNWYYYDKLPDWKCRYYLAIRNISNVMKFPQVGELIKATNPEKMFYVVDDMRVFDKEFADGLGIPYEVLNTDINYYPGKYPSTGFVMLDRLPNAVCIGYGKSDTHCNSMFHNFPWEHEYVEKHRTNILLK